MKIAAAIRYHLLFSLIALHVALCYLLRLKPRAYLRFLWQAATLLGVFRHNRIVKTDSGYKLQLYLPPWPSKAFFDVLDGKLLHSPPAPISLVSSITRACGYQCPHCYQKLEKAADIDEALLMRTMQDCLNLGVRFFNLEGGEPFLRFERLMAMLRLAGKQAEIWVNTTGDGVDEAKLRQAQALGLAGLMVSIHATDPAAHDNFTGAAGSFARACDTIRLAKKLRLAVSVNSVLDEKAIRHGGLDRLMSLARDLKADYVQLIHPKPCGGWLNQTAMQLDPELLRYIENQHVHYNSWRKAGFPALAAQVFEERRDGVGCTAGGVDRFYISAGGEVQPCEFLQISFGNVTDEAFADIFCRMRRAMFTPGTEWLCCTKSQVIAQYMRAHNIATTPLLWPHTAQLLAEWQPDNPTPLYVKLGIYADADNC